MSLNGALLPLAICGALALAAACTTTTVVSPSAGSETASAATASPTPDPTPSPSAAGPSAPARASASAASSEGPLGDAESCDNEAIGFSVDYPEGWWANEDVEPDFAGGTPIPACTYFGPEPVELRPNAGLPQGIAIWFDVETQFEFTGDTLSEEETTVDGRSAVAMETEATGAGGFTPEGTRTYAYVVALADGRQLLAQTTTVYIDEETYADAKPILDAMMESLEFDD